MHLYHFNRILGLTLAVLTCQVLVISCQSIPRIPTPSEATNLSLQLAVKLTDGSRLIGTTALTTFPLRSEALGTMTIPLDKVRSLQFSPDPESVIVSLANGDKLQGSLGTVSLKLQTLLGEVTVPLKHVTEIVIQPSGERLVEWEVLPFPINSDWPGPRGELAKVNADEIVIRGQPVWTKQTYSAPLTFECEFTVDQPPTDLEYAAITLIPEGADKRLNPPIGSLDVLLQYEGTSHAGGHLYIQRRGRDVISLAKTPFALRAGQPYHLRVEVLVDALRVTLNGQTYDAAGITLPFKTFHIQLDGWKPDKVWRARTISVR